MVVEASVEEYRKVVEGVLSGKNVKMTTVL